jgi:hypothetical protein
LHPEGYHVRVFELAQQLLEIQGLRVGGVYVPGRDGQLEGHPLFLWVTEGGFGTIGFDLSRV